jgi:hypothetical protein
MVQYFAPLLFVWDSARHVDAAVSGSQLHSVNANPTSQLVSVCVNHTQPLG